MKVLLYASVGIVQPYGTDKLFASVENPIPLLRKLFSHQPTTKKNYMNTPTVLITGALTGIGRATALAFAHEGARVVVSGRHDKAREYGIVDHVK